MPASATRLRARISGRKLAADSPTGTNLRLLEQRDSPAAGLNWRGGGSIATPISLRQLVLLLWEGNPIPRTHRHPRYSDPCPSLFSNHRASGYIYGSEGTLHPLVGPTPQLQKETNIAYSGNQTVSILPPRAANMLAATAIARESQVSSPAPFEKVDFRCTWCKNETSGLPDVLHQTYPEGASR